MYAFISTISIHALHRLSQLEKLQHLDLGGNSLKEIPEAVYSLQQLTELNLSKYMYSILGHRYVFKVSYPFDITCLCAC